LKEILNKEEIDMLTSKQTNALKNFSIVYNSEPQKKRFKLLSPLKLAGFSLKEARMLNFEVGRNIWKNCTNLNQRNKGGRPILKSIFTGGINLHVKKFSEPAANRYLIKSKKNARYRLGTFKSLYNSYQFKTRMSFQTFRNKISKDFKKPHRLSDLCDICEHGNVSS
jgi:hypothetical protein